MIKHVARCADFRLIDVSRGADLDRLMAIRRSQLIVMFRVTASVAQDQPYS